MSKPNFDSVILSELSVKSARDAILQNCGDLPVSTHKKVGDLNRHALRLSGAPPCAVFLLAAHYHPAHRNGASWASTPLLIIEFDDCQRPQNEDEIFEGAQRDTARAAALMAALLGKSTGLTLPNLVVYCKR